MESQGVNDCSKQEKDFAFALNDGLLASRGALRLKPEDDIQGLELDYSLVAWDADFRYDHGEWSYHESLIMKNNERKKHHQLR